MFLSMGVKKVMFIFSRGFVGSFKRLVMWCMASLIVLLTILEERNAKIF